MFPSGTASLHQLRVYRRVYRDGSLRKGQTGGENQADQGLTLPLYVVIVVTSIHGYIDICIACSCFVKRVLCLLVP